jgi:hypothetical protein
MTPFSPLSEFEESEVLAGELETFLLTTTGGQFINAIREYALYLDGRQTGTPQDGARAVVDKMLSLTLSRRNARIERMKAQRSPSSGNAKHLQRKPPPPPASRVPKPEVLQPNP